MNTIQLDNAADRVALVSGATGGMGSAICAALLADGLQVVMLGRDPARLEAARTPLAKGAAAERLTTQVIDIGDPASVSDGVARILKRHGRVTDLVHAAGDGPVWRRCWRPRLEGGSLLDSRGVSGARRGGSMTTRRKMLSAMAMLLSARAFGASSRWTRDRVVAGGLSSPVGMALDRDGRLLVANWSAGTVLSLDAGGKALVVAEELNGPSGLALSPQGEVYVASYSGDVVWRIDRAGRKEVFVRGLGTPAGLSFDREGRLLIANRSTNQVLAADAAGRVSVAVEGELQTPVGAVQLPDGSYFVSNINGGVSFAGQNGRAHTVSREFAQPGPGIAVADDDSVYVVDYGGTEVKQVGKDGRTRVVASGLKSPVGLVVAVGRKTAIVADWGTNIAYGFRIPGI